MRLSKLQDLPEDSCRQVISVVNACNMTFYYSDNWTESYSLVCNKEEPFSLSFDVTEALKDSLSTTCDLCLQEDVRNLWDLGVCEKPNHFGFTVAVSVFYVLIFIAALIGNLLVVCVVGGTAKMRTVTNYFIVNLAVGDLCMAIFCIPFTFVTTIILQYWPFGEVMCVIVNYLQVSKIVQ